MTDFSDFNMKRPKSGLIGHRGVAALAPENTMAGFRLAAELGIDWIEFDLRLIKDDSLVIFHDDRLDRTTNGTGWIDHKTFNEIEILDAGAWFAPQYQGEKIPIFPKVLTELLDLTLSLNIELKTVDAPTQSNLSRFASQFCKTMLNLWPKNQALPLISSFHWPLLSLVQKELPSAPIGFLTEVCTQEQILQVAKLPHSALHCDYQSLTSQLIDFAHTHRVPLLAYTVNDPKIAQDLLQAGVFALFSDNPTLICDSV